MSPLRYLCLFAYSGVFVLFFFVFFVYVASFSEFSFLIAPSVFSNVYYLCDIDWLLLLLLWSFHCLLLGARYQLQFNFGCM